MTKCCVVFKTVSLETLHLQNTDALVGLAKKTSETVMLVSLQIENFALIDRLELSFGEGLNVLTGETGAGKSIILDALDLALGGKASQRALRSGASRMVIEAQFRMSETVQKWLQAADIDLLDESVVVCSREMSLPQGTLRSRSRVNGVLVNKQQMDELRDRLVDITAQGQTLQLGQAALQRDWLDGFGGAEVLAQRQTVQQQFERFHKAQTRLNQFRQNQQQRFQQIDILTYQRSELQEAALSDPDEQQTLEQEVLRLSHSVELQQQSFQSYQLLYDHPEGQACADLLGEALTILQQMSAVDQGVQPILEMVQDGLAQVQEAGLQLHRYGDALETDPDRLEEIQLRLQLLKQICRKYGPTLAEAIAYQSRIEAELDALTGEGTSLEALETELETFQQSLQEGCQTLTTLRQHTAQILEARLIAALKPLALDKVQFQIQLESIAPAAHGADRIVFRFSPNPGEPLLPLTEIASGGEMSRFLLALKACFSDVEQVPTLVFDEVDVGVSGRVAQSIAEKLHQLGTHRQVLCITHQPIVAAMADHHFHVEKQVLPSVRTAARSQDASIDSERTVVRIYPLTETERSQEIAHLVGSETTVQTLAFAESLLQQANQIRNQHTAPLPAKSDRKKRIRKTA
jgi:DNA repair protein RecN (Recombination protein N)